MRPSCLRLWNSIMLVLITVLMRELSVYVFQHKVGSKEQESGNIRELLVLIGEVQAVPCGQPLEDPAGVF